MKIMYVACDGTQFSDLCKCEDYEFLLNHQALHDIQMYSACGDPVYNPLSENTYLEVATIEVPTSDAVKDLQALADYTGFDAYGTITSPGTWRYDTSKCRFVTYFE